jgi:tripartite-type tricarboxylate transporter receptor subunit TctC
MPRASVRKNGEGYMQKLLVATLLATVTLVTAQAQDWPTRAITLVLPYAAGGPVDTVGRLLAPRMSEILGQQVVIENTTGAGGVTGVLRVMKSPPDGYQFVLSAAGTFAHSQTLFKHPPYNSVTDFASIGLIAEAPPILITRKDLPAHDLKEFIAYVKANHGKMQFASGGAASGAHITCLLLNSSIGVEVTHVPYRGTAAAYPDLLAGRFDYMCDYIASALPHIRSHAVNAIATMTRERASVLPALATAHEQGLTDFDAPGWYAFSAPKGTPEPIIRRLNKAMSDALDTPAVGDRLRELGTIPVAKERRTPEYLTQYIVSEIKKWDAPIRASGVSY